MSPTGIDEDGRIGFGDSNMISEKGKEQMVPKIDSVALQIGLHPPCRSCGLHLEF
jgi:hypothetical protein